MCMLIVSRLSGRMSRTSRRGKSNKRGRKQRRPKSFKKPNLSRGTPPAALPLWIQIEGLKRRGVMVQVEDSYLILLRECIIANVSARTLREFGINQIAFLGWDPSLNLKIILAHLNKPSASVDKSKRLPTRRAVQAILQLRHKNAHALLRALIKDQTIGHALDNLETVVDNLFRDSGHWELLESVDEHIKWARFLYSV